MNSTTINATRTVTNNWGFKSQIQFLVAHRLAWRFGHAWGQVYREREVRTRTESGADKIEFERVTPSSPAEAYKWVQEDNEKYQPTGQQYGVPTPRWESGSGTFKIKVTPEGYANIIYNAILWEKFFPQITENGVEIFSKEVGLMPNWHLTNFKWDWEAKTHNGRGRNLSQSVTLACKRGGREGVDLKLVEIFESDKNFWRTGFLAGTNWYE